MLSCESPSESSTSEAETRFVQPWSHVEGFRLAAAAKLPTLLICLRATRESHGEDRKTEGSIGEGERVRIRKMHLDAGEG